MSDAETKGQRAGHAPLSASSRRAVLDAYNSLLFAEARERDRQLWKVGAIRKYRDAVLSGENGAPEMAELVRRLNILDEPAEEVRRG